MSEIIRMLPAVALRATTILPGMIVHFDLSREKSIKAVEEAMRQDQRIFLVTQRDENVEVPALEDVYEVGTIAVIKQLVKLPKGFVRLMVEGLMRGKLLSFEPREDMLEAELLECETPDLDSFTETSKEALMRNLKEEFAAYCQQSQKISRDLMVQILELDDLEKLTDRIAVNIPVTWKQRQQILNGILLSERYEELCVVLASEIEVMKIHADIQARVKEKIDKNQREYVLKEKIRLIHEELGDTNVESDIDLFKSQVEELEASEEIKDKLRNEIKRLEAVINNPSESGVIRGYIETCLSMPWDHMSEDNQDLKSARKILEEDHYGLEKVKERILEYLAVRILTKKGDAPILCLVGPPGTGKTSIAKSVARALDKAYVRISLGGVRDEAEILGHRKTYVAAMPGRIVQGLRQAKVKNPLMLLDELDKMSSDYRGETASAMLEVLDSEQNCRFVDHYIEMPIDLSEVLFIATANDAQNIPGPLRDRVEMIEISSYTENEKSHIAREHLVPKQMKINGLLRSQLKISAKAIDEIISGYTWEAGVRSLERQIGRICRKAALRIQEEHADRVSVTARNLQDFLGRKKYLPKPVNTKPEIGVVRGLAWTSVGGETLQIEVNIMPGKGEFRLTGQLGDVMKESAQAGISYIRSIADRYEIPQEFFGENDIHIHIPEGAVPKDGPSAGITMATAMLSAITRIPVRSDIAMTGEITLRGRVLPIGGLKEKMLAAKKAGVATVIVPKQNEPDAAEMEQEIKEGLEIVFAERMEEVLQHALVSEKDAD